MSGVARPDQLPCVVFRLESVSCAVALSSVIRVLPAVEVTPLPGAPELIMGVIDMGGRIIPVASVRRRFHFPERDLRLTDQFLIVAFPARGAPEGREITLALGVDEVVGVRDVATWETPAETILSGLEYLRGVAKTPEGLILVHDLDRFLSPEEESLLAQSIVGGSR
jgi:purine-binding chemotaxis protein CheW